MLICFRCGIPECDQNSNEYEPSWLVNAVPYTQDVPNKCDMFLYNSTEIIANETCPASDFDRNEITRCSSFIYKTEEKSILQEVKCTTICTLNYDFWILLYFSIICNVVTICGNWLWLEQSTVLDNFLDFSLLECCQIGK